MDSFLQVLKNRSFFFLWLSEIFSLTGFNMVNFLLTLVTYSLTNSNTAVSGIVLSFTIPAILFGIVAGVYVDRWNKKQVLLITNIIRCLLAVILGLFHTNLIVLYLATCAIAIVTQFFIPAETPMIPLLVERKFLLTANALFSVAWFGAAFIAYALSGPFILYFGVSHSLLVLAGAFAIAAVCTGLIIVKNENNTENRRQYTVFQEAKKTFTVILQLGDVSHAFFLLAFSQILLLVISVIGPGYAQHILGINVNEFPIRFVTPAVIGMACGSFIVTKYFYNLNRHKSATIGVFLAGASVLFMPYGSQVVLRSFVQTINPYLPQLFRVTTLHIMVVLAFVLGMSNSFMFVPSNTLIQENTPDELRGKVYGALNSITYLLSLLPVIMAGSLADIFGVGNILLGIGSIIIIIGLLRLMI